MKVVKIDKGAANFEQIEKEKQKMRKEKREAREGREAARKAKKENEQFMVRAMVRVRSIAHRTRSYGKDGPSSVPAFLPFLSFSLCNDQTLGCGTEPFDSWYMTINRIR